MSPRDSLTWPFTCAPEGVAESSACAEPSVATSSRAVSTLPRSRRGKAHVITSEAEAINIARELAATLHPYSTQRENEAKAPRRQLELFSQSGLAGLIVPRSHGGIAASLATQTAVLKIIGAVDPGVAQIIVAQYSYGDHLVVHGSPFLKDFLLPRLLAGERLANAVAEIDGKTSRDFVSRLSARTKGGFLLNGRKFYSTGSYLSHWFVVAALDDAGQRVQMFVKRDAPGVEVIHDWNGLGQRNSLSGTATFTDVVIAPEFLFNPTGTYAPHTGGIAQLLHAAIDAGIARGALEAMRDFLLTQSRVRGGTGVERPSLEPQVIKQAGEFVVLEHSSDAMVARAAELLDALRRDPNTRQKQIDALIAVDEARAQADHAALTISSDMFALLGARSSWAQWNLDRFWRNARTHTVHDPVRVKFSNVGNWLLNGVVPGAGRGPAKSNPDTPPAH